MSRLVEVGCEEARLDFDESAVGALFAFLDAEVDRWQIPDGDLSIQFVDEAICRRLHNDFFGDPEVTDVMTFPGDPGDAHAGDLAICPAHAVDSAIAHGLSFSEEVTLYLVHGWLHLAGLDDRSEATVPAMREAEAVLMNRLRENKSIPNFRWNIEVVPS